MEIPEDMKQKIGLFCNVRAEDVIQNLTAPSLYEVPLWLEKRALQMLFVIILSLSADSQTLKSGRK